MVKIQFIKQQIRKWKCSVIDYEAKMKLSTTKNLNSHDITIILQALLPAYTGSLSVTELFLAQIDIGHDVVYDWLDKDRFYLAVNHHQTLPDLVATIANNHAVNIELDYFPIPTLLRTRECTVLSVKVKSR